MNNPGFKVESLEDQILERVFDQRLVLCITDPIWSVIGDS